MDPAAKYSISTSLSRAAMLPFESNTDELAILETSSPVSRRDNELKEVNGLSRSRLSALRLLAAENAGEASTESDLLRGG